MSSAACAHDNPPGARFCAQCGAALAAVPTTPDGERRWVSVLFADLTGYTALTESRDPEDIALLLERLRATLAPVVASQGGTVNQFVGDEVMAVFGLPIARRDDARRAVRAALRMRQAMRAADLGTGLALHSGVASGLVVARRSDSLGGAWTLTGDAVNVAARLRSLAAPGEVMINAECWEQVAPYFRATAQGAIEVKGREQAVVTHRVDDERAIGAMAGGPLVGRENELALLHAALDLCLKHGHVSAVVISGEAGVGKTRLAQEFLHAVDVLGVECHSAVAYDFGVTRDDDPLVTWTRSLLGAAATVDVNDRAALGAYIEQSPVGPGLSVMLYELADIDPPAEARMRLAAFDADARQDSRRAALQALLAHRSEPLVLHLDDIQFADPALLQELDALLDAAIPRPVLLLATQRYHRAVEQGTPSAVPLPRAHRLKLGLLSPSAAMSMAALLGATAHSEVDIAALVKRANGNPLFLEQLLRHPALASNDMPGSLLALVQSRIDALPQADRRAIQIAAVLGVHWSLRDLRELLADAAYEPALLEQHELVRSDGSGYVFCHGLLRDGAYASVLLSTRRQMHVQAADWFSQGADAARAAEHYERADDTRAAGCYLDAAQAAVGRHRHERALSLAERGLNVARDEASVRHALTMTRARCLIELGRVAEAIAAARAALALAGQPRERFDALLTMAAGMRLSDQLGEGLAVLDEAQKIDLEGPAHAAHARLHHLRGNLLFPAGNAAACLREHAQALVEARAAGDLEAEANAASGLGDAYFLEGRMRSANAEFQRTVTLAKAHGYLRIEVAATQILGWTAHFLLDFGGAAALGQAAVNLASQVAHLRAELITRSMLFWVEAIVRRAAAFDDAYVADNIRRAQQLGAKRFEAQGWMSRAMLHHLRGDAAQAEADIALALDICRVHGMGYVGPFACAVQAVIAPTREASHAALAAGESALEGGCVSHNHLYLHALGIDAMLKHGEWSRVEHHCARLLAVTAAEPLPWSEYLVSRGRALLRHARGERSPGLRQELTALTMRARELRFALALPLLEQALEAQNSGGARVTP